MTELLFLLNAALAGYLLVQGLWKRGGYLEVPFLSALVFAIWFLPQIYVLLDDITLPDGSVARVLVMSLLCLVAIAAGWKEGSAKLPARPIGENINIDRLVVATACATAFAMTMHIAVMAQPDEDRAVAQWTGPLTILAFFGQVRIPALVLSLVLLIRRRTIVTMALAAPNLFLYAVPILVYFRRAGVFEFVFSVLLVLYFLKGKAIPRALVFTGAVFGFLFINAAGELRGLSGGYALNEVGKIETRFPTLDELMAIDWFGMDRFRQGQYISEARNAVVYMQSIEEQGAIGFGSAFWDMMVHAYVPGQLVGFDFKQSLKVGYDLILLALRSAGYETIPGATSTGFPVLYYDFWYFGALVYFFITRFLAQQFTRARAGSFESLTIYAVLLPQSIQGITHSGYQLLVYAPLPVFVVWLTFRYARQPPQRVQPSVRQPAPPRIDVPYGQKSAADWKRR